MENLKALAAYLKPRLVAAFWFTLAIIFLIESWIWDHVKDWLRLLERALGLERFEPWLQNIVSRLSPQMTLAIFAVPMIGVLPFKIAAFALLFSMANCGLPGTAGFVGEWMVILGTVKANFWLGLLAAYAYTTMSLGTSLTISASFARSVAPLASQSRSVDPHSMPVTVLCLIVPIMVLGLACICNYWPCKGY